MNNNVSIYPTSESVRNRHFEKTQIIKRQSSALSRFLISEYPGYSLISEPITAREKHYSLVGYMLTVDIYFLLSNQSTRKVLFICSANTNDKYNKDNNNNNNNDNNNNNNNNDDDDDDDDDVV